MLKDELYYILL